MTKITAQKNLSEQTLSNVYTHELGLLTVTDKELQGKRIHIPNAPPEGVIHFGNCSYLGLEIDPRMKNAAVDAVQRFGTQFSSSRAYAGIQLHNELEHLLEQTYGQPVLTAGSTTLAHIAAIPLLVKPEDAVILDHQVHNSVQNAVQLVKIKGTHVEYVRHNHMEKLETRIQVLSQSHRQVWYMADGVYSMFGDIAPCKALVELMNRYECFRCYIDDAHGVAWVGESGCGQVMNDIDFHPQMILAGSLAKGFGSSGGFLVFPDSKTKQMVQYYGSTLIFSIATAPSILGASVEAVKIMQTDEGSQRQIALQERILYFIRTAQSLGLPLVNDALTPVFYIGVGTPNMGYKIGQQMIKAGYFTNIAVYPVVPHKNTGLRITVTLHQSLEDIQNMLCQLAQFLEAEEIAQQVSRNDIFRAFGMKL